MSADAIRGRIKNLPPLPLVAHKLLTLMKQDDCSANDVTKILCSDQTLAGKVLKLANSSFYGMSGQVGSVSRAVVILGFSAIRSMALGLGMAQAIQTASHGLDLAYFWRHALFTAGAARTVAVETGGVDPEEVFVAGLVHDLGRLVLEMVTPGLRTHMASVSSDKLLQTETELAGMSHTKAGQQVMRHWKLPEGLVQMARFHHHETSFRSDHTGLIAYVQLGELMARSLGHSEEPPALDPAPEALAAHVGLSLVTTADLLARTCQEVSRTRAFLEISGVDVEYEDPLAHLEPEAADPSATGTAVYLGTDPERAGWVHGLLELQAWAVVPMRAFLAGDGGAVDLAILDPRSISTGQAAKLRTILAERGTRICTLGPAAELAEVVGKAAELPVAFCRDELLALRDSVPA
ncbi:HDOD domain-containing protein [bacterium]|nr:HDOD domain-containing protein [bacterium]